MDVNGIEVIPGAQRLVRSLRDVGYEFVTAVADLIDNSIEAGARTVWIDLVWDGEASRVVIADNGKGMTRRQLEEAMRFGSERKYGDKDLGKFGLGLKTASLSQCQRFTVATRHDPDHAQIDALCWDISHVAATNRWEVLPIGTTGLPSGVRHHLHDTTGTVVIWERLDRILGYKRPDGERARQQLQAMCRELDAHLAMVFHRFLSGETRGRRLAIYVNDSKVVPWDPFARSEEHTRCMEASKFRHDSALGVGGIVVEPFVLPHSSRFSSPEAFNRASGPGKWNRQQGFYIYRAGRMIQSGGWCGLRAQDEHRKLARIAVSFDPVLDDEFRINVAKMRVSLPHAMRDVIAEAIAPAIVIAEEHYRQRERTVSLPPAVSRKAVEVRPCPAPDPRAAHMPSKPAADKDELVAIVPAVALPALSGTRAPANLHENRGQHVADDMAAVTRNDIEKVAMLLRLLSGPEEAVTLDSLVARAISCIEGQASPARFSTSPTSSAICTAR